MIAVYTRAFEKEFERLPIKIQDIFYEKIKILLNNPFDPILGNHKLKGQMKHYRSINITGDYRLIYEDLGNGYLRVMRIGTHSELYE